MKKQLTGFFLCICLAILAGCSAREPDRLTLEKVRELSGKGEELTWSDFEQYEVPAFILWSMILIDNIN